MVAPGSVRARRAVPMVALALVAVLLGVVAKGGLQVALARQGLDLRLILLLGELLLVVPGLVLVAAARVPLAEALAPVPLPGRTVLLSLAAGMTLWGASLGLFALQFLAWPPPDDYLEAFRQLHAALRPSGAADAFFSITAIAIVPAACEETLFRGIVWSWLRAAMAARPALFLQALLFALIHIDPTPGGSFVVSRVPFAFAVGLALGVLRLRTGSLAASALAHALLNAITFLVVLLAEDPGRDTDPGPLLGLALLVGGTLGTVLLLRALPRTEAPAPPSRATAD